jgi:hypothetical protein
MLELDRSCWELHGTAVELDGSHRSLFIRTKQSTTKHSSDVSCPRKKDERNEHAIAFKIRPAAVGPRESV